MVSQATLAPWQTDFHALYRSGAFNHMFYARRYPDVLRSGLRPLEHFVKYGAFLGRRPSATMPGLDVTLDGPDQAAVSARLGIIAQRNRKGPRVSVLCITYNQQAHIAEALDGMLMQETQFDFEILVGDDASSDETSSIVAAYAHRHRQVVHVLRTSNVGANANFVDIARKARGEYVAICEGDDYWTDPHKLQRQVDFLDAHPEYTVHFHKVRVLLEGQPDVEEFFPDVCAAEVSLERLSRSNVIQTNSVMYRWRYGRGERFDLRPDLAPGDWFIHLLHAEVGRVAYDDSVMAVYRKHDKGMWSSHRNALARHMKHGNSEIQFFREAATRLPQFRQRFETAQIDIFSRVTEAYLAKPALESMRLLCLANPDIARRALDTMGFDLSHDLFSDADAFAEALMDQLTVSVVVTSYNHRTTIGRALESILAQHGGFRLEIIVGDDCSPDDTASIVDRYCELHPGVITRIQHARNVGMLQNLKQCIAACSGRFIAFCEGDDFWLSTSKLQRQLSVMRSDKTIGLCFSWLLLHLEDDGYYMPHNEQGALPTGPVSFWQLARAPLTANFSCCLYRAEAVRAVPPSYYASSTGADWLFNLYIADRSKVIFLRELLSVYTLHSKGSWTGLAEHAKSSRVKQYRREFSQIFGSDRGFEDAPLSIDVAAIGDGPPVALVTANLDLPLPGLLTLDNGALTIAGWVLPKGIAELVVLIDDGRGLARVVPEFVRTDVLEAFTVDPSLQAFVERCGFQTSVAYRPGLQVTLAIEIDGLVYPWLVITTRSGGSSD